jgi:primosomal protein N' (replication factor Y)
MFAEVAVNRRVSGTFSYHIPPELAGKIAPGHLVKVAFGTAHTTGIVVALVDSVDIPETKPILERIDPLPVVTPVQIELARWLSAESLTPLAACLWLMLPPGLAKRGDFLYTLLQEDSNGSLSTVQERILGLLKRRGPLRGRQLTHSLPQTNWQSSMTALVKRGVVEQEPVLDSPDVKPKMVRTVQLAIPASRVKDIAPRIGSESRRANILEALITARGHRMQLSALCLAVGCTPTPVKALAKSGEVIIEPRQTWIELAVPNDEIEARLASAMYARAPAQAKLLRKLLKAGGAVPLGDLNRPIVAQLEEVTTVRRSEEPAWVELAISPKDAQQRIIDLRGSQPYLDILNALVHEPDPVNVGEIYAKTGATLVRLQRLADDGLVTLGEAESWRDPLVDHEYVPVLAPPLTTEQAQAWNTIQRYMDTVHWGRVSPRPDTSGVFLLHGVTGSGKTEIYLRAVEHVLAQGRQAIVLVPEISLTPQTIHRFAARFPGRVSVVHSGLSVGERYDTWRRARSGDLHVIVGARSALFTPLPDVGLIILDEEHDDSYKSSAPITPPFYHARETAIKMMQLTRGTVLLGSATPDEVTYYRATHNQYTLLHLPDRVIAHRERLAEQTRRLNAPVARYQPTSASDAMSAALPDVRIVDMRQELRAGNRSIFSRPLHTAITEVLARHEQTILFLNRRGTATFVMCRNCGYIANCPRCSTPLTYHGPQQALVCHYCGYTHDQISVCPECHSTKIKHFGQGTELIESAVQTTFPHARTIRWDRDTATGRDAHEMILKSFSERRADILIGTQMVAKGLDLPHVTLVGIISADTALGLPDYRSGERTFQLLTQVAGRAGRGALGGHVILQSYLPEHYAIRAAAGHDYETFFKQELEFRREQMYPPFRRLARLVFQYETAQRAEQEARFAAQTLQNHITGMQYTATEIIGPTPCFFAKRNNLYRWHLVLRSPDPAAVLSGIDRPDAWLIDIDPVDML